MGTEIPGGGGQEKLHLTLHCHHQSDDCIKIGSVDSHCYMFHLTARGKSTRQCHTETTTRIKYCNRFTVIFSGHIFDVKYSSVLLYVLRNRRLNRDGSPGRPPRLSLTQLLSSDFDVKLKRCNKVDSRVEVETRCVAVGWRMGWGRGSGVGGEGGGETTGGPMWPAVPGF